MPPRAAALQGAREIGFTVLSISVSLVAVFLPILLMGGIVGRLFREFAAVLSVAIVISLVVSLTTTPMMCGALLRPRRPTAPERRRGPARSRARRHGERLPPRPRLGAAAPALDAGASRCSPWRSTCSLFAVVPKGFFPQQDTGRLAGGIQAAQDISFQAMSEKLRDGGRRRSRANPTSRACSASPAAAAVAAAAPQHRRASSSTLTPPETRSADRRRGARAAARPAGAASRARRRSSSRCRTCASAGGPATRSTSTRCRPAAWTSSPTRAPRCSRSSAACRSSSTSAATSRTAASRRRW